MIPTTTGYAGAQVWKGYPHEGVKDGEIGDMESVRDQNGTLWCCWKTESIWERLKLFFTGKVWIGVMSERQPPVSCVAGASLE